ncbi:hypothetical protein BDW22DRAFT_1340233, partial [Trametopsis cervina]
SKHVNTHVKQRFQSLKEIQLPLNNHCQQEIINLWIVCRFILHNFIICTAEEIRSRYGWCGRGATKSGTRRVES